MAPLYLSQLYPIHVSSGLGGQPNTHTRLIMFHDISRAAEGICVKILLATLLEHHGEARTISDNLAHLALLTGGSKS